MRWDAGRRTVDSEGTVRRQRGRSFTWLACDVCGQLVLAKGLAPDPERLGDPAYRETHGRKCRMTPRCSGRHVVADPSAAFEPLGGD